MFCFENISLNVPARICARVHLLFATGAHFEHPRRVHIVHNEIMKLLLLQMLMSSGAV